jgi:hypothetical protein
VTATGQRLRGTSPAAAAEGRAALGEQFPIVGGARVETGDAYAVRSPYDDRRGGWRRTSAPVFSSV